MIKILITMILFKVNTFNFYKLLIITVAIFRVYGTFLMNAFSTEMGDCCIANYWGPASQKALNSFLPFYSSLDKSLILSLERFGKILEYLLPCAELFNKHSFINFCMISFFSGFSTWYAWTRSIYGTPFWCDNIL